MTIEFQFNSVTIQSADMQENCPYMFSVCQPYLPAPKPVRRRRPKKKKETVAHLIDAVIENIDSDITSCKK